MSVECVSLTVHIELSLLCGLAQVVGGGDSVDAGLLQPHVLHHQLEALLLPIFKDFVVLGRLDYVAIFAPDK